MSDLTDLAARIDTMSLAELMAEGADADLPTCGGDYDTRRGWAERLGVCTGSAQFKNLMDNLQAAGLMTEVRGRVERGGGWTTCRLLHCPSLAGKLG